MKYSNIPSSVIAKYAHILTGIVFAATSVLPLATSVMAQAGPTLTVTARTRTPLIPASSEVVYRIKVSNTTSSPAYRVKVTNVLPTGFTYSKHLTTLQKKAVKFGTADKFTDAAYTNKPVAGANTLVWDNITIPNGGSIEFIFAATASATPSTTPYSMSSLRVDSYGSATGGTLTTTTASVSGTEDDVTLKPIPPTPSLSIARTPITYEPPMCAIPGGQGLGVNLTGIVNTYFKPTLQTVAAESRTIAIASGAAKGAAQDIKPGDLVLIVQMQDASISTAESAAYGSGDIVNQGSGQTSMGSSGLYEYAIADSTVLAASGNVNLTLRKPLINTYTSAAATTNSGQKRFQVVRVPQYASATIQGTMFASPWDGNVGGILAVDTFGTFDLNGQRLSVNEAGFRGGFGLKNNYLIAAQEGFVARTNVYGMDSSQNVLLNSDKSPTTVTTQRTLGSGKGEGVAGTPRFVSTKVLDGTESGTLAPRWTGDFIDNKAEGYPGGDTGRGAPANAGGGGNGHNSGGGGGGNGGNGGQGSIGYGFTGSGYTSLIKDAGGRPGSSSLLNTPTPMKVFMGGGGGGGEANHAMQGVPGGAGGGIVMLRAGTIVNTSTTSAIIYANGAKGERGAQGTNPDGAGGGGAGGTVLIQSRNPTTASITIEAKGGAGGSTEQDAFYNYKNSPVTNALSQTNGNGYSPDGYVYDQGQEPHGPGGGGAGGIVLYNVTSSATITPVVTGGASGLTDDRSPSTTLKDATNTVLLSTLGAKTQNSNGATAGSSGQVVRFSNSDDRFADLNAQTACSPSNLEIKVSTTTKSAAPGTTFGYTVTVTNPASSGGATGVMLNIPLPTGLTYTSTDSINLNSGTTSATGSTTANPTAGSTVPTWGPFTIPPGATVEIVFKATIGESAANALAPFRVDAVYSNPLRLSDTASNATITKSYGVDPAETGGDITVTKRTVPLVWNVSPTVRIVRK
ncbi:hypothetical protein [Chamaesiphon sp. OTE_8_metabat_110]|uniref:hypothetical protein n=1 Tax=Chamaesiphon sp. OTE_8_metabat_110 TaxID=2964696 RepID=UPI00286C2CBF|nr:hypothetical protein [Chamaesiphon sp. OTE_8_metabat_110]